MYIKEEYYSILNASRTDSLDEIKKKYKRLALKHHPDVGGSEEYFKKINLAMDIINEFHEENYNKQDNKSTNYKNTYQRNKSSNQHRKRTTNAKNNQKNNGRTKCPHCGRIDPDALNYCIYCGKKLNPIDKTAIFLFLIGAIVFSSVSKILGIIFFIYLYRHYK